MKLKIDYIQDFIDDQCGDFDCPVVVRKVDNKYRSINYPNKEAYITEHISDTIFSDFEKYRLMYAQEVCEYKEYQSLDSMGFYLGIPYYKVECVDFDTQRTAVKEKLCKVDDLKIELLKVERADYLRLIQRFKTTLFNATIEEKRSAIKKAVDVRHKLDSNLLSSEFCSSTGVISYLTKLCEKLASDIESETMYNASINKQVCYETKRIDLLEKAQQQKYTEISSSINTAIANKVSLYSQKYSNDNVEEFFSFILRDSFYWFDFKCNPTLEYERSNKILIVEYHLPNLSEIPNIKEIKYYITKGREIKYLSERELNKAYDDFIYKITIRSIAEIFYFDSKQLIDTVLFNGRVESRNTATGQLEDNCILSVQVKRDEFEKIDLNYVDAKACFKHFKGVGAAKLNSMSAVVPIMETSRYDKRFRASKEVVVDNSTNLAAMHWEDFEHLIRELFEKEFSVNGGEVKVTQASRDGGVDAIAFDPDPIRGGKIVIQAKRYTNTVGVSAVRDLYGTVINEGANKGILITTSDYGSDSYSFARAKPLTLLNGGHLLYLLEKHGEKARIDIDEAKRLAKESV